MYLSGSLDLDKLAHPMRRESDIHSIGLNLDSSHRTAITNAPDHCKIDIGYLDEERDLLPLATIARENNRFVLSVPSYSFLALYFIKVGGILHWSTNIGALVASSGAHSRNRKYERFGLKYQFWPGCETVYARIKKLLPGQRMIAEASGLKIEPLPSRNAPSSELDPEDDVAVNKAIHEILLEAVEQLSKPNETMGVMLGGFDSALVVALLAEIGRPVHAVTLGYEEDKYNQKNISQVVSRFGIPHDWVRIDAELIRDGLYHYGELFDQPVTQPHNLISGLQLARTLSERGISRTLTGDGCDGTFFGYPSVFRKAKLVRTLRYLPGPVKRSMRWLLGAGGAERLAGQPARLARQLLETTSRPDDLHFFLTAMAVDNESAALALHSEAGSDYFEEAVLEDLYQSTVKGKDWVDTTYISKNMVGLNRTKLAAIWNQGDIEKIHSPYMMPRVTAMAKSIPKSYWLSDDNPSGKFLLARMAVEHGLLSDEIVYQRKMAPNCSPADHWLRYDLRGDIEGMLSESPLLNIDYCKDLLRERRLEEWYKRNITIDDYACQALCMLLSYSRMVDASPGQNE